MEHEAAFVKAFIVPAKRARYAQFLAIPKRRPEVLERFNRELAYLPALATEVPGDQDFPEALETLLMSKGAGSRCHVMVDGLKIDGHELPLRDALRAIFMHRGGAVLSCVPGRLAYYKPEAPAAGILLEAR
ncbi:MAG TPA: hypothetical protein VJ483_04935 [Holophagaceae bacterium]|nr:hypothetical protein [Holophagaceae bacterium]